MITGKKYYQSLPKKHLATGVIFLNSQNKILLVRPNYKDHWSIPGGVVSENESPRQAGIREVKEEIGLTVNNLVFVCVDYAIPAGIKDESLQFMFFGGVLTSEQTARISLQKNELTDYRFATFAEAEKLVKSKKMHTSFPSRLRESLKILGKNSAIYLEDGQRK